MDLDEIIRCLETIHLTPQAFLPQRQNEIRTLQEFVQGLATGDSEHVSAGNNPTLSSSLCL
jgi:hypothetical protein